MDDSAIILNQLEANIGWKNKQLQHLGCNLNMALTLKLSSPQDICGLRDRDIPLLSNEENEFHFQNDQRALLGETIKLIHVSGNHRYLMTKKPLMDASHKIQGVIYHCQLLGSYQVHAAENPFQLSKRELQCLAYLLRAHSTKEIADQLSLSKRTIDFYIDNIKNKFGCHTKSALLLAAIDAGYQSNIPQ